MLLAYNGRGEGLNEYYLNCSSDHTNTRFPEVTHCLLLELDLGPVLVDVGFGTHDYMEASLFLRTFMAANGMPRDPEEMAIRQLAGLGFVPEEVRHSVLTHLHLDHAGPQSDFPRAWIHVFRAELGAAM